MGIIKADDELGRESSKNGYDSVYKSHTYRDYLFNKRPQNASAKRFVVFLSIDVVALWVVLGILKNLTDAKEIIALIVGIAWLAGRAGIIWVKLLAFIGKNNESIKRGWKSIKQMFKE